MSSYVTRKTPGDTEWFRHDRFGMFASKYTDYKCTNTPAGRDLVRKYVDEYPFKNIRIGGLQAKLITHRSYTMEARCSTPRAVLRDMICERDVRMTSQLRLIFRPLNRIH